MHRLNWLPLLALTILLGRTESLAEEGKEIFKEKVRAIFSTKCLKCHGGEETQGEFDLTSEALFLKGGTRGTPLAKKAEESLLYQMLLGTKKPQMPLDEEPLSAEELESIKTWIEAGGKYDQALVDESGPPAWTTRLIDPKARDHWSYQPLCNSAIPVVKHPDWCATLVDHFVLHRLEQAGVAPNPRASKRTLLRRLYLDLIGTPPSIEELVAFENDQSPNAYEKLVDRLLASPHYGERWGRHWLDLARFAESHGFEHDYDRPTAYHYRDFVIQALNQDMPYDQFVRWQIAGDEFAPEDRLALMGTGFLAAGVHSTQITKNEVEKHRYDEMDDMLATIGSSIMGLSVGCARCHDHKFDAIPQRDYYRMLATFTTTVRSEVDLDFDPEGYRIAKEKFDQEHAPFVKERENYEKTDLGSRLAKWESEEKEKLLTSSWLLPVIESIESAGKATFTKQPDGSYLLSGPNPDNDTWTIVLKGDVAGLRQLRLEALSDPSLVKGGPGRAENGNFALSSLELRQGDGEGTLVQLQSPRATFEQNGLPVAALIDDNPTSAWAVDPEFGKNHAAIVEFASPLEPGRLKLTLKFLNNVRHSIGRVRLSVTTSEEPGPFEGTPIPVEVRDALVTERDQRSPKQTEELLGWYRLFDPGWQALTKKIDEHMALEPKKDLRKVLISTEGLPAVRLHTQGGDFLEATHFLRRGDPNLKDGTAEFGLLQTLCTDESQHKPSPPSGSRTSHRRTAFSNWLTDSEQGAGHLVARVIVNRLWQHHFGRGLVRTASDFGVRGESPSHPELLDFLASELIRNGWRLKSIHKLMLTSAVYMQDSSIVPEKQRIDPDNVLLWRWTRRRLEAEAIRDSALAVAGLIDDTQFGPGTLDPNSRRRSIYFTVKRSQILPMMLIFDCPDALSSSGERARTIVPMQSLYMMNNELYRAAARELGKSIRKDHPGDEAIIRAFERAITRRPTESELTAARTFIAQQTESHRSQSTQVPGKGNNGHAPEDLAFTDFCQVLLLLTEFSYIE